MITTTVFVSFCLVAATLNWSVFSCFCMMKFRGKMKRDHSIHISFHLYIIIYFFILWDSFIDGKLCLSAD